MGDGLRAFSLALLAATALACSADKVSLSGQCTVTSDCALPLVCAGQRCREECHDARDCDDGDQCLPVGAARACVPPDSEVPCRFASDCPATALCVEDRCRAQCREDRDCPSGQTCAGERCSGTLRTPASSDAGGADAGGADAGGADAGDCTGGRVDCGEGCTDLATDTTHCGACDRACASNEVCRGGRCECQPPHVTCGAECVELAESSAHCGGCDQRCDGPCREATCCGAGQAFCEGACVPVDTDARCGDCDVACGEGERCVDSACLLANDRCEGATTVTLVEGTRLVLARPAGPAEDDGACTDHDDLFYRLVLPRRSLVHIQGETEMGLRVGGCGAPTIGCEANLVEVLPAGEHILSVELYSPGAVSIEHVPVDDAPVAPLPPSPFGVSVDATSAAAVAGTCDPLPKVAYWFGAPDLPSSTLEAAATVCGATEATLELRSSDGADAPRCAAAAASCGGPTLETTFPRDLGGLYVLFVGVPPDAPASLDLSGSFL